MIRKNILAVAAFTLPLSAALHASSPLIPLNENKSAAIFFVADANATYSDNIFYRRDKIADTTFTIAPGFELVAGKDSNVSFTLVAKESLTAYIDHSNLNNQRASVDASLAYDPQQRLKASLKGGYHQLVQPTIQTALDGEIVRNDSFNGNVFAEYKASEKSTIVGGLNYGGTRYTTHTELFNDQDSFNIPVKWLYAVTDKLNMGFTYAYTYTTILASDIQSEDGNQQIHFIGLTSSGSISDKLKLSSSVGLGSSKIDFADSSTSSDDTTFNFDLEATYIVTDKLTAQITGARNFSAGSQGQQITTTSGGGSLQYVIDERWSANANTGYMVQKFKGSGGGEDGIFTAGCGVSYVPNQYWRIGASYSYMNDDSTRGGGLANDFDNNTLLLNVSLKY